MTPALCTRCSQHRGCCQSRARWPRQRWAPCCHGHIGGQVSWELWGHRWSAARGRVLLGQESRGDRALCWGRPPAQESGSVGCEDLALTTPLPPPPQDAAGWEFVAFLLVGTGLRLNWGSDSLQGVLLTWPPLSLSGLPGWVASARLAFPTAAGRGQSPGRRLTCHAVLSPVPDRPSRAPRPCLGRAEWPTGTALSSASQLCSSP